MDDPLRQPGKRRPYICLNNPDDLRIRIEQATAFLADNITASFQFDDEIVRQHPEMVDDYAFSTCNVGEGGVVVVESEQALNSTRKRRHTLTPDGNWTTTHR